MPTEGCRNVSKLLDSSLTCMCCAVSCDYVIHMSCKHAHNIQACMAAHDRLLLQDKAQLCCVALNKQFMLSQLLSTDSQVC